MKATISLLFLFILVIGCSSQEAQNAGNEDEQTEWIVLFDGKTFDGWRGFKKDVVPEGWVITENAELYFMGKGKGYIMTDGQYDNFELELEWKISEGGNSGIFFRVSEDDNAVYRTAPEMQVLDNAKHKDGKIPEESAGSNYALHAPFADVTNEVGQYNKIRIIARENHIEHWMNGQKLLEYEIDSPAWKELVANSKFGKMPKYGTYSKGHIALQDHGDKVWYRNIRIRPLPSTSTH